MTDERRKAAAVARVPPCPLFLPKEDRLMEADAESRDREVEVRLWWHTLRREQMLGRRLRPEGYPCQSQFPIFTEALRV